MDKDILRVVIIALGITVMAGMIVWSFFKNRKPRGNLDFYDKKDPLGKIDDSLVLNTENDDFDVVPLGSVSDDLSAESDPIFNDTTQYRESMAYDSEAFEPEIQAEEPNEISDLKDEDFITEEFAEPIPEVVEPNVEEPRFEVPKIIQIQVLALDYDGFKGENLLKVFKKSKLEYGSLKIFERLDEQRRVDFAVASMVEPGTFPEKEIEMQEFTCPGIVFFIQPAELDDPKAIFDEFIEVIDMISAQLEGVQLDSKREPLSKEYIKQVRAALSVY